MLNPKEFTPRTITEKVIIFLAYYVVFETLITKYVFKNNAIFKYIPEGIVYGLFAYTLVIFIKENKRMTMQKHEVSLIILLVYLFATTVIINRIDIKIFALSIRTLYRYILLYFIITNVDFNIENIERIIKHVKIGGIISLGFGCLQIVAPGPINPILTPGAYQIGDMVRDNFLVIDGKAIFSLFERYDRYGIYLIIFILLMMGCDYSKKINLVIIAIACGNMVYTYSRQAWIGLAVAALIGFLLRKQYFLVFYSASVSGFGLYVLLANGQEAEDVYFGSPLQRLLQLFSSSYMQTNLESARLRIFVEVLPAFLSRFKIYTILGLGIGNFAALANSLTGYELYMRYFILFNMEYTGIYHISDVYWIELIMELGIVGIAIFLVFFISALKYHYQNYVKRSDELSKQLNLLAFELIAATIAINFFGPNMLITGYSFFLWLLLGLSVRTNIILKQE